MGSLSRIRKRPLIDTARKRRSVREGRQNISSTTRRAAARHGEHFHRIFRLDVERRHRVTEKDRPECRASVQDRVGYAREERRIRERACQL